MATNSTSKISKLYDLGTAYDVAKLVNVMIRDFSLVSPLYTHRLSLNCQLVERGFDPLCYTCGRYLIAELYATARVPLRLFPRKMTIPDTVVRVILAVGITSESLPMQPAHGRGKGNTIVKTFYL